ncbi:uncharacterized protein TNCV_1420501 [Trichonephila clavipes]|nr:uncharacterized protein TNCV_1420501 [Trichonephila clavipes]
MLDLILSGLAKPSLYVYTDHAKVFIWTDKMAWTVGKRPHPDWTLAGYLQGKLIFRSFNDLILGASVQQMRANKQADMNQDRLIKSLPSDARILCNKGIAEMIPILRRLNDPFYMVMVHYKTFPDFLTQYVLNRHLGIRIELQGCSWNDGIVVIEFIRSQSGFLYNMEQEYHEYGRAFMSKYVSEENGWTLAPDAWFLW